MAGDEGARCEGLGERFAGHIHQGCSNNEAQQRWLIDAEVVKALGIGVS